MKMKRICAVLLAASLLCPAAGCGKKTENGSGTAVQTDAPSLQELYAVNTMETYREAGLQASLSTCLREIVDQKTVEEQNNLVTMYPSEDQEIGFVTRDRIGDVPFTYYFTHDGTDYSIVHTSTKNPETEEILEQAAMTVHPSFEKGQYSLAEQAFVNMGFGVYDSREKLISVTDCGDTYHYVTDISEMSYTDAEAKYVFKTQEYDVDKETHYILDMFRTYSKEQNDGEKKEYMFYRCLTYGTGYIPLPDMVHEMIAGNWERTITFQTEEEDYEITVPSELPVSIVIPDGYTAYLDREHETVYESGSMEMGELTDQTLYLVSQDT